MTLLAFMDSRFLLTSALLVGALLLGAVIVGAVRRWQQMNDRGRMTANEQLAQFRALYERGELSEEEFRRLRDLLAVQIRQETGLPGHKPPPPEGGVKPP
ncbi:MAG: SHOCT domain-containing protein [Gemmataceae bacterium]